MIDHYTRIYREFVCAVLWIVLAAIVAYRWIA